MFVNLIFGLADGSESLVSGDGVNTIESRFTATDEEGSDTCIHGLDRVCLCTWSMAEVSYALARTAEAVAACRARQRSACKVWTKSGSEGCSTVLGYSFIDF